MNKPFPVSTCYYINQKRIALDYLDRISKINLKKLLPVMVSIFLALIFLLFLVSWFPGALTIVLATILVSVLVVTQTIVILKDRG